MKLKQIIQEELEKTLNEISPRTKFVSGGFEGIIQMAEKAESAINNLESKFEGEAPQDLYVIQSFIESIKKAALYQAGSGEALWALHDPKSSQDIQKTVRRYHTPAYKRDTG